MKSASTDDRRLRRIRCATSTTELATSAARLGLVLLATATSLAMAACSTPSTQPPAPPAAGVQHGAGDTFASVGAFYGVPVLGKSFFWDGNGEVDDSGLDLHAGRFVEEDVAIGVGSRFATWWTPGKDVYSGEFEGLLRIYPVHSLPLFVDGTGGYQLANDDIPPGGTVWNFTFGFGSGVDLAVGDHSSVQMGATYHHISNALGRQNDRNPSQNEVRFWLGYAWNF